MSDAIVYVDGFNLYYGCLKGTPYKWLDLDALSHLLLPNDTIKRIKYFTAPLVPLPHDPAAAQRQQVYFRALRTIPHLDIIEGHFKSNSVWLHLAHPVPGGPRSAHVIRNEEKGSDVNLGIHLIIDAVDQAFDVAAVVSDDSDLALPIETVVNRFGRPVIMLAPLSRRKRRKASRELVRVATAWKPIRAGPIAASQFPPLLSDANGTITKPPSW